MWKNLLSRKGVKMHIDKILFTTIAAGLLATTAVMAEDIDDSQKLLGIEVGAATIEADTFGVLGEANHRGSDVEFGIRFGAQNEEWRTMLMLDYFDSSDDDQEYWKGLATVDYWITRQSNFKPYVGLNLGYLSYTTSGIDDDGDFIYGMQAGFAVDMGEAVQLDLAYRYSFSASDYVDHVEGVVLAVDYKF
jgi:opacity protein-like surface antigen